MLPFYVLLISFLLAGACLWFRDKKHHWHLAGRIALSIMLLFTALGHFMYAEGMAKMIPDFIPLKLPIVWLTGIVEVAAAIGLHLPKPRRLTGWLLLLFFVLILPANIKAAMENLNYQTGQYDGPGLAYLWFRIPFQLLLLAWTYWFVVRPVKNRIYA